ncbi:cytochrome C assembly protein [Methanosarcinales archaeon]|nr:MAG: cytochrome C assembly protein [Methanosarcinales archaeon]
MVGVLVKRILIVLSILFVVCASFMIFCTAPVPVDAGERGSFMSEQEWQNYQDSFKIFYFHLPIAITTYLAFGVLFVSNLIYLRLERGGLNKGGHSSARLWDFRASSAGEVGVVFAALTLISGSIWAKNAWGVYWLWDVRLTTSLVLLLIYLSYFMVRQAIEEPEKRARLSAVFGVIGFICVPLSFLSIRLWRAHHPLVIGGGGISGAEVILPLAVNFAAYITLAATLILFRVENEEVRDEIEELKREKTVNYQ